MRGSESRDASANARHPQAELQVAIFILMCNCSFIGQNNRGPTASPTGVRAIVDAPSLPMCLAGPKSRSRGCLCIRRGSPRFEHIPD